MSLRTSHSLPPVLKDKQGRKRRLVNLLEIKIKAGHEAVPEVQSHDLEKGGAEVKRQKNRSATNTRFRPGATGACEGQLWIFVGPQRIPDDDDPPEVHWVSAESLDAALRYLRQRFDDFIIREARLVAVIPLLSGSPWTN